MSAPTWQSAVNEVVHGHAHMAQRAGGRRRRRDDVRGVSTAAADEAQLLTGEDAAHAEAQTGDLAAAGTIVPMPDLGIAHRLPGGGMNLWQMPLSELETEYGQPGLVQTLKYGGFCYGKPRALSGGPG